MKLMMSISGVRGVIGDGFDPQLITRAMTALAKHVKGGTVVMGRDSRPTGEAVMRMASSVLTLSGCDVIDVGIVPTPTVQIMVEKLKASAGIVVSASHNPVEWNAFKFINAKGSFFAQKEIDALFALFDAPAVYPPYNRTGRYFTDDSAFMTHIDMVLASVDVAKIRKKRFTVALDSVNGAGSYITQELLERLGCTVIPVHCTIDGTFPRVAEPLAENLSDLCRAVKKHDADIGFAQDPDADRLAIVDENGRAIGEEYTVAIAADHVLSTVTGPVVVNMSTTRAVEDVAKRHGVKFYRSAVGEINVVEEMRRRKAAVGGEGNGGVIAPALHLGRDSLAGIAFTLEYLAARKCSVREAVDALPFYVMKKGKVTATPAAQKKVYALLKKQYAAEKIDLLDGMRIDFTSEGPMQGGWVHLRASNTEPVFRIISEGISEKQAAQIQSHFTKLVGSV